MKKIQNDNKSYLRYIIAKGRLVAKTGEANRVVIPGDVMRQKLAGSCLKDQEVWETYNCEFFQVPIQREAGNFSNKNFHIRELAPPYRSV